jgi:hypothetical protein
VTYSQTTKVAQQEADNRNRIIYLRKVGPNQWDYSTRDRAGETYRIFPRAYLQAEIESGSILAGDEYRAAIAALLTTRGGLSVDTRRARRRKLQEGDLTPCPAATKNCPAACACACGRAGPGTCTCAC